MLINILIHFGMITNGDKMRDNILSERFASVVLFAQLTIFETHYPLLDARTLLMC